MRDDAAMLTRDAGEWAGLFFSSFLFFFFQEKGRPGWRVFFFFLTVVAWDALGGNDGEFRAE